MLLFEKMQVLGLDGRVLTLGFHDAGSVKGFTSGGHDEVLRLAIMDVAGADWRIDPVHQPGARPHLRRGREAGTAARTQRPRSGSDPAGPATPAGSGKTADPEPDVPSLTDDDAADDGLAGADLVARELGGRVIGELGGT